MKGKDRWNRRIETWLPWFLFLAALSVRLFYLSENRHSPFFDHPRLDGLFHDNWAQSIAAGNLIGDQVFFRAPLYPYVLGIVYGFFGHDYVVARVFQHVLGAISVVLVYCIAKRLFTKTVSIIAALITMVYPVLVYFEGELLIETLLVVLLLAWLHALFRAVEKPSTTRWVIAGLWLGLVCITRPTFLIIGPVVSLCALLIMKKRVIDRPSSVRLGLIGFLAMLVPIIPITIRNYYIEKDFVLIASQGGLNFYIGNNPEANGYSSAIPGEGGLSWENREVSYHVEKELGYRPKPSQESDYWYGKAFRFITSEPLKFLELTARKAHLFWNYYEIPNNRSYYFSKQYSSFLKLNPLGFGFIGPLSLVGLFLAWRLKSARILIAFVFFYFVLTILFFVCDRFRIPVVPMCAIFASFTVASLWELIRKKNLRYGALVALACLSLGFGLNIRTSEFEKDNFAREHYSLGIIGLEEDDYDRALREFSRADSLNDNLPGLHAHWAVAEWMRGRRDIAFTRLKEELRHYPNSFAALLELSLAYFELGEMDSSILYGRQSITARPYVPLPYTTVGRALIRQNRIEEARSVLIWGAGECGEDFLYGQYLEAGLDLADRKIERAEQTYRTILNKLNVSHQPGYEPEFSFSNEYRYGQNFNELRGKVLYGLGLVFASQERVDSAAAYFREAISLLPRQSDIWADLGVALLRTGRLKEAEAALRRAIELNDMNHLYWFNLGVALINQQKVAEAESVFTTVLKLKPDFEPAMEYLVAVKKRKQ